MLISFASNGQSYDFWNNNRVCEREDKNMWKGEKKHGGKNSLLYENMAKCTNCQTWNTFQITHNRKNPVQKKKVKLCVNWCNFSLKINVVVDVRSIYINNFKWSNQFPSKKPINSTNHKILAMYIVDTHTHTLYNPIFWTWYLGWAWHLGEKVLSIMLLPPCESINVKWCMSFLSIHWVS